MITKLLSIACLSMLSTYLVGCGSSGLKIDREFRPLLDLYLSHAPNHGMIMELESMTWGDPGAANEGICLRYKNGINGTSINFERARKIIISPIFDGPCGLRKTVLHELGHCLHDLDHSSDPHDIMFGDSEVLSEEEIEEREQFWCENTETKLIEMFEKMGK